MICECVAISTETTDLPSPHPTPSALSRRPIWRHDKGTRLRAGRLLGAEEDLQLVPLAILHRHRDDEGLAQGGVDGPPLEGHVAAHGAVAVLHGDAPVLPGRSKDRKRYEHPQTAFGRRLVTFGNRFQKGESPIGDPKTHTTFHLTLLCRADPPRRWRSPGSRR